MSLSTSWLSRSLTTRSPAWIQALAHSTSSLAPLVRHYSSSYFPRALGHVGAMHLLNNSTSSRAVQTNTLSHPHDFFHHSNPFQLPEKQAWHHQRFGHLEHTHLGSLEAIPESALHWPRDFQMTFLSCKGHALTYKVVNATLEADRVAEIFQAAIDEQEGNSEYEWHHSAQAIRDKVATGKYSIWGTYDRTDHNKLIAVNSCEFLPGQRAVHWIWGAVDPACRGRGVWENVGVFMDKMIEKTGVQEGIVWMATVSGVQTIETVVKSDTERLTFPLSQHRHTT